MSMLWIDYKTADDMVLQTWIIECLKMNQISDKLIKFIMKAMKNQKVELATGRQTLAEVKFKIDIFQKDLLSLFLFFFINDVTQLYTQKEHRRFQIYKISRKDKPFYVYGWYQDICLKRKKNTRNLDRNNKNTEPR